jgi:hypothetical protein
MIPPLPSLYLLQLCAVYVTFFPDRFRVVKLL